MTELRQRLLEAFAVEHREHLEAVRRYLENAGREGSLPSAEELVELHRRLHSLKGAARATDLRPIETLAHRLESLVQKVQHGERALDAEATGVILSGLDAIEDWFAAFAAGNEPPPIEQAVAAAEGKPAEGGQAPPPPAIRESVHLDVDSLDRLLRSAGEMLVANGGLQHVDFEIRRLAAMAEALAKDVEGYQSRLTGMPGGGRDEAMRAVHGIGIQARALTAEAQEISRRQRGLVWRNAQLGRLLHEQIQQVRMVPTDSVFGGFRKMVRDIAKDEGKKVAVHVAGAETRADRMVLQRLKDPLLHLLRNAVDHGLETPTERRASGRSETGTISIDVAARAGRLELRVEDDGRGLDLATIERAARGLGLRREEEPGIQGIAEAGNVLLHPGFTTAGSVSELSGRGLGLSVVHQAVSVLQGEIGFEPGDAGGLVIKISVPLSIGTTRILLVSAGGQRYALPVHGVERLYRVRLDELDVAAGRPMLALEGESDAIGVAGLDGLLGGTSDPLARSEQITLALLRGGSQRMAIAVDAALGVRDAVVEQVGDLVPGTELVSGTIILDDGEVIPMLNAVALFEHYGAVGEVRPLQPAPAEAKQVPVVLVVDDSITTRTLEKSILEANGYRVRVSVDGIDALEQMRHAAVDLVVTDIEMPRMDGFDLLREMKRDPALGNVPVVLVTSRDNEPDRKRGLSLGADAYVVKQRFDQTVLLDTIGQLL